MIFFDTETCGLHGPIVLIQWARDGGPINLHSVWKVPVKETLRLIEAMCHHEEGVCAFNLAFDWFHICQLYTTLSLLYVKYGNVIPEDYITEYASLEKEARDGPCLKPVTALDLLLHARKGPYQSTMDRKDIRIKRVPTAIAYQLADELTKRIPLPDVYFARFKDSSRRWLVHDIDGEIDFKDIVLKFSPSSGLKALAADALGVDTESIKMFQEVEVNSAFIPDECGYAPYAEAAGINGWPRYIKHHISHWEFHKPARKYAKDDVRYTRDLYVYFDKPEAGDDDSILACMVGAIRWRGYKVDIEKILSLRSDCIKLLQSITFNFNSPDVCKRYLQQAMSETEASLLTTTKRTVLEEIAKWKESYVCDVCNGFGCTGCTDGLILKDEPHPAASRAKEILEARTIQKEIELYDKIIHAGRFHASFKVIGTLSGRMSGSDGLNAQGIKNSPEVRSSFPLAHDDMVLSGGDFDGFEVTIMDAVYADPDLRDDLLSGKKIHGLFGECLFPGNTYEDIMNTKELPGDANLYVRSKRGVFALAYGGNDYTLTDRVGIDSQTAEEGYQTWVRKYKVWGQERSKIFDDFCSMRQPNGIGTKVEWHEPKDFVETMFGFRRYFTLENKIVKVLFNLAEDPPKHWHNVNMKVVRRDRVQTATGAVRSALFAAAFAVQASNMRAAANHVIQSAGSTITKMLQVRLWGLQHSGIREWAIMPLNIHDEIMSPLREELVESANRITTNFVEEMKDCVPLIAITWHRELTSWAGK